VKLLVEEYKKQVEQWPQEGRHILAQFDDDKVVVYQAYKPSIGLYAAENGYFGGDFSYSRMSWIKPNFLWMMYRCGWASKAGQETVLAIHIKRAFFDDLLSEAFPSSNTMGLSKPEWNSKVAASDVRLQWDPDHDPYGNKETRRAIQLGLRNDYLKPFQGEGIIAIENITEFVLEQSEHVKKGDLSRLITPAERCYPVSSLARKNLRMDNTETV